MSILVFLRCLHIKKTTTKELYIEIRTKAVTAKMNKLQAVKGRGGSRHRFEKNASKVCVHIQLTVEGTCS